MATKTGKNFEQLVASIETRLHPAATITPNDKIEDVHTGRKRQIDVSIRITSDYLRVLGIVEVRDRGRPVTVEFVEQIAKKRESVRADAAIIVSKSGFCGTAKEKARALGIRTISFDEVGATDWPGWLQVRAIKVLTKHFDNINLSLKTESNTSTFDAALNGKTLQEVEILDETGNLFVFASVLVEQSINQQDEFFFADIGVEEGHVVKNIKFENLEPPLFLRSDEGPLCRITEVLLTAEVWIEIKECPFELRIYSPSDNEKPSAQVASAVVPLGNRVGQFHIIAPSAGDILEAGAILTFRLNPLEEA